MIVGIVGGIGAGKSTVARLFGELGAAVIHADPIAHEVLETPRVRKALEAALGESFTGKDGKVDRKAIARRVFSSPAELKLLEDLIHPAVTERIESMVEEIGRERLVVLDVPLLASSPLRQRCDEIVFVHAEPDVRRARIAERGWSPEEMERRESRQADAETKRSLADHIIDNSGTLEETRRQVERLHAIWADASTSSPAAPGVRTLEAGNQ